MANINRNIPCLITINEMIQSLLLDDTHDEHGIWIATFKDHENMTFADNKNALEKIFPELVFYSDAEISKIRSENNYPENESWKSKNKYKIN